MMLRQELVVLEALKARRRLTKIGLQAKHVKMATTLRRYRMQKTTVLRAMTKILRQAQSSGIFLLRYPTPRTTVHKQGINLPRKTKLQTTTPRPYLILKITVHQAKIRHLNLAHLQEM